MSPPAQPCPRALPLPHPCPQPASPSVTCSPLRAWWMVRLRLLCMVNRMALPVWLNRGAPATYTRPCLEDTIDVTVYPATGGNRLVSAPAPGLHLKTGQPGEGRAEAKPRGGVSQEQRGRPGRGLRRGVWRLGRTHVPHPTLEGAKEARWGYRHCRPGTYMCPPSPAPPRRA